MKISSINLESFYDLPCSVYWKDLKGVYLGLNDYAALTVGGPGPNEVISYKDSDLMVPEVVSTIRNNDSQVITNKNPLIVVENATFVNEKKFNHYTVLSLKQPVYSQRNSNKVIGLLALSFILTPYQLVSDFFNRFNLRIDSSLSDQISYMQKRMNLTMEERKLTQRQADCLYHMVQGKTAKQIASIINLSFRTVEHHINVMKKKYNCHSRSELISLALKMDFIKQRLAK